MRPHWREHFLQELRHTSPLYHSSTDFRRICEETAASEAISTQAARTCFRQRAPTCAVPCPTTHLSPRKPSDTDWLCHLSTFRGENHTASAESALFWQAGRFFFRFFFRTQIVISMERCSWGDFHGGPEWPPLLSHTSSVVRGAQNRQVCGSKTPPLASRGVRAF